MSKKLPKEAVAFAKSMGLDLNGLEVEAQDIWRKLNELSESDPLQYHQFVSEQLKQGQEETSSTGKSSGTAVGSDRNDQDNKTGRSFRPEAGFCVHLETYGGDGLKIREVDVASGKEKGKGKTLYVNMCGSKAIEQATDRHGAALKKESLLRCADGLSIPLIVGIPRDFTIDVADGLPSPAIAVDVVFHPTLIDLCEVVVFKRQVVDLALEWVGNETELDFSKSWEMDSVSYRGGRGEQGDVPVLFFVTEEMLNGSTNTEKAKNKTKEETGVLSSTSSLLNQIQQDSNESTIQDLNLSSQNQPLKSSMSVRLPGEFSTAPASNAESSKSSASTARKSKLVQELDEDRNVIASNDDEVGGSDDRTPTTVSGKERDAVNKDEGLFGKIAGKLGEKKSKKSKKSAKVSFDPENLKPIVKPPSKAEYLEMEKLIEQMDDEFGKSVHPQALELEKATEQSMSIFSGLAKILSGRDLDENKEILEKKDKLAPPTTPSRDNKGNLLIERNLPETIKSSAKFEDGSKNDVTDVMLKRGLKALPDQVKLVVYIEGLPATLEAADINLKVSATVVEVTLPDGRSLRVLCNDVNVILDPNNAKASFKRKKASFSLSIGCKI